MDNIEEDGVGRLAVCRMGLVGVVEGSRMVDPVDEKEVLLYEGHQLLHPERRWHSVDPRWISPKQGDQILSRLYSQDMS